MTAGGKARGGLAPAAIVIIESGAIYSACLILLLSLYLSGIYAQYILLDAVQQVVVRHVSLIILSNLDYNYHTSLHFIIRGLYSPLS